MNKYGKVFIAGVGPGDPKLITLKAVECIQKADVIVYDRLINLRILQYAKLDAKLIFVGKMPDHHTVLQYSINQILVDHAKEGKIVTRIKGGDPFVFGRGGEEIETLVQNGIEFEVIPGITSAVSVPAYAGIPVTHRDYCSSLNIITGHERPEKEESVIKFDVLAKTEGTLVFLMSIKNLDFITSSLIQNGKNQDTPVAVIKDGTTPKQKVIIGTLADISKKISEAGMTSPAVTVIGDVVNLREKMSWYPKGALIGKTIVVTRAREQASILVDMLEANGADVIEFPTIRIEKLENYVEFDRTLSNIDKFKWLVFTSVNGVIAFFTRMKEQCIDIRRLSGIRICAIGKVTAAEIQKLGIIVDYMPQEFTSPKLLEGLLRILQKGEKVLLVRADIADENLVNWLLENGIDVQALTAYRTVVEDRFKDQIDNLFRDKKVDFITFTSSSTVKNFISLIGIDGIRKINARVICIGPVTAETVRRNGIDVHVTADEYTISGLVSKLINL